MLIIGMGGQGKVVLDCALALKRYCKITFMANDLTTTGILGYPVIIEQETSIHQIQSNFDEVIVALGDNDFRLNKSNFFLNNNIKLATLVHPSAVVSEFAQIGAGTVVLANSVINPFATIGKACIINTGSIVEHDCELGNGVHIAPKVAMGGTVLIGDKTMVCIGSNIANNLKIGKNSVIGAGATVLGDIPDGVLAVGVPAIIKKRYIS